MINEHIRRSIFMGLCSSNFAIDNFVENFLALFTHYSDVGLLPALKDLLDQGLSSVNIAIV